MCAGVQVDFFETLEQCMLDGVDQADRYRVYSVDCRFDCLGNVVPKRQSELIVQRSEFLVQQVFLSVVLEVQVVGGEQPLECKP